ncbi:TetR/AcrR family transcriptional regulator [Actinomadura chibensis]|uniref:TetR/AcrR family transcriptional regulator n=1 Tax=Actinomadura chibensis TaxID=392828 RepID=A0A5D0NG87_9ACTN|nr:TetR/AcrR family transcriptional regulator [Actinomadura chibensis]TYB43476.1 TetR/AcrR family transcriptional regulator [Actinomadura chibensis]
MPRVSEEHLERRRRQILDAARACFVRKGIHDTSMQDIFAEAGLSAGAVYRYFKSKNEIIEANIASVAGELQAFLHELAHTDPPLPIDELVERLAVRLAELSAEGGPLRLAPEAWALAVHEPEIARYVAENLTRIRDTWTYYLGRLVDAGQLPPGTDVAAAGKALFAIMPGFLLQRLIVKDISPAELRRGIKALTRDSMLAPLA